MAEEPPAVKSHLASDTITVIIVILTVLSIFLAGAMLYMKRQIDAYQRDASNYMAFQDKKENETSSMF